MDDTQNFGPTNLSPEARETIFQEFLETVEGRGKLATACLRPAQDKVNLISSDPTQASLADQMIADMERIQSEMTGEEEYDQAQFAALLSDLKTLRDEIQGKKVVKRL